MSQNQLNREIANATGESVEYIRRHGFQEVIVPDRHYRPQSDTSTQATAKQQSYVLPNVQQKKAA